MLAYQMTLQIDAVKNAKTTVNVTRKRNGILENNKVEWNILNNIQAKKCLKSPISLFICQERELNISMVILSRQEALSENEAELTIKDFFEKSNIEILSFETSEFKEITLSECYNLLIQAENSDLLKSGFRFYKDLGFGALREQMDLEYRKNDFKIEEYISSANFTTKKEALSHTKKILGDITLKDEIKRIYHKNNCRKFLAHPVHYYIHAQSRDVAKEIIDALVGALYSVGRLLGKRIAYLCDLESNGNKERFLKGIFETSGFSTIAVELSSNKSPVGLISRRQIMDEEDFLSFLTEETGKNTSKTLFIYVEISEKKEDNINNFIFGLEKSSDIIPLEEGSCNEKQAKVYLNYLASLNSVSYFSEDDINAALVKGEYTPTKVRKIFDDLRRKELCKNYFPSYHNAKIISKENKLSANKKHNAALKLNQMVGLKEVKSFINRIIATHKIRKVREDLKIKAERSPLHMIFKGNPGCAKTTVARLLGEILKEENILSTGVFVECGRSDLVGKYVGWTAKIVKQKFKDAKGGILFIDEAYSLVDDSMSFGDEAINTIVQEMENNKDDILVIFAGYSDKMNEFIERNEGLRSRISFHLDFPNYNESELIEILALMAKEKGYRLNNAIKNKCKEIFKEAIKTENFGNGRYVRNLLNEAIMNQSERLTSKTNVANISKNQAMCLTVADFKKINISGKTEKYDIGFKPGFAFLSETDNYSE